MKSWKTQKGTSITRILFGRCNVYLISTATVNLLVDTGMKGEGKKLIERLSRTGKPDAVIMTHTHFDHAGNAGLLMEKFAPQFVVQEEEKDFLESGNSPIPHGNVGWTRFLYRLGPHRVPHWFQVPGVKASLVFTERFDLSPLGINGYVVHTPGHSAGSSCVVVDDEIVIAGDALGGMPGAIFPPWGDDGRQMVSSWKKLLDTGCHTFHPAHGFPISRQRLEQEYLKRSSW